MNILILGNAQDIHAAHVHDALVKAGAIAHYLDLSLFPSKIQLSWQPETQEGTLTLPGQYHLHLHQIQSIFWRQISPVVIPELPEPEQRLLAVNDCMSALRSLMKGSNIQWVNSWEAYEFHKEKPLQLSTVQQCGVNIPATLISNNPQQIIEFAHQYPKVIFKPVYGGAHTKLVTKAHLEPQRLNQVLRLSPVTLQEYIPGTNIRSYVIDQAVYAAEIRSDALDFRQDAQAILIPHALPETLREQCLRIARSLQLTWTAIDWRLKPTGEYIFLEANPSPMFIHFERQTRFPITANLVQLLMKTQKRW